MSGVFLIIKSEEWVSYIFMKTFKRGDFMKKLRVVQVGTKHDHAADATLTLMQMKEDFELLGVVEEDALLLKKAKENPDYNSVNFVSFEDAVALKPDAFLIET